MQSDITWSSLPSEILSLIADNSGRDCKEVKWMFVNKNWFTFFLSQTYHSISIDLNNNDKKVTKILSSSFDPGKWVRRITFEKVIPPSDMKRLDMLNDPFIQLMKRTPNVNEIQFGNVENLLGYMAWTYLSVALMRTSYWKLHVLPKSGEENLAYSAYYYLCAYHLRNTLKKLYLSVGMVGALDFGFLKEFKTLEMLELDSDLVYDLNDLHLLLRQIPSLKDIIVRFANNRIELTQECSSAKKEHEYLNLKKLTFHNYTPKLNEDLLVFTEQFTRLNELNIVGEKNSRWPANEVPDAAIDIFLDTINSLPSYEITLPGGAQGAYFTGKWIKLMTWSKQTIYLSIIYVNKDSLDHLEKCRGSSITIKACQFSSTLTLQYQIFHGSTDSTEGRNILENISDNVSQVEITGTVSDNTRTEMLLRKLISKEQATIKTLIVNNTTFNSYTSPNNAVIVRQHIRSVTFRNCIVGLNSLKKFTNEFAMLDYVNFDGCAFEGDLNNSGIDMPNTEFGTIYMSNYRKIIAGRQYTDRIQPLIIVSVYCASRNIKKYYTITENIITESSKVLFDVLIPNLNSDSFVVVNIRVKSLKELILKLTDNYKKVKITF